MATNTGRLDTTTLDFGTSTAAGVFTTQVTVGKSGTDAILVSRFDGTATHAARITNVADPTNGTDAVPLDYLRSRTRPVVVQATTFQDQPLTGFTPPLVIDDITVVNGQQVLLAGQSNLQDRGIYTYTAAPTPTLARSTFYNSGSLGGVVVLSVATPPAGPEGNNLCAFVCTSNPAVIGTDDIEFVTYSQVDGRLGNSDVRFEDNRLTSNTKTLELGTDASPTNTLQCNVRNVKFGRLDPTDQQITLSQEDNNVAKFTSSVQATNFLSTSDRRLKNNIQPLDIGLDELRRLRAYTFEWASNGRPDVGVVAQDVREVAPHVVTESDGYFRVDYSRLVPYLLRWNELLTQELYDRRRRTTSGRSWKAKRSIPRRLAEPSRVE
jgi:hypothetical protein